MTVAGLGAYDPDNVFARILRGEIPADRVFEDEHVVAFNDIAPKAPVHVLVVPRQAYVSFADFVRRASGDEVVGFFRMAGQVDYLLHIVVPGIDAYDDVYKRLIARIDLYDVSASFAMEVLKSTTALPLHYAPGA